MFSSRISHSETPFFLLFLELSPIAVKMPIAASKRRIQQILGKSNSSNNSEYREYKRRWQQIFSPLLHNSKVFTSFSWQSHLKMFGICQHAPMNK